MSRLPCDGHGGEARGRLLGFYGTLVKDSVRFTTYRRYCLDCMSRLLHEHRSDWLPGGIWGAVDGPVSCTSCGEIAATEDKLRPFYVTCYVRPDQRVDYFARYCDNCSDLVTDGLGLTEKVNGKH